MFFCPHPYSPPPHHHNFWVSCVFGDAAIPSPSSAARCFRAVCWAPAWSCPSSALASDSTRTGKSLSEVRGRQPDSLLISSVKLDISLRAEHGSFSSNQSAPPHISGMLHGDMLLSCPLHQQHGLSPLHPLFFSAALLSGASGANSPTSNER